jgi:hypothetical protein
LQARHDVGEQRIEYSLLALSQSEHQPSGAGIRIDRTDARDDLSHRHR